MIVLFINRKYRDCKNECINCKNIELCFWTWNSIITNCFESLNRSSYYNSLTQNVRNIPPILTLNTLKIYKQSAFLFVFHMMVRKKQNCFPIKHEMHLHNILPHRKRIMYFLKKVNQLTHIVNQRDNNIATNII
jgi:hypothetical protein